MRNPPPLTPEEVARLGNPFTVKVRPGGRMNGVTLEDGPDGARLAVTTTEAPEDGKANAAVLALAARAIGIAPTRLSIIAGARSRLKRIRIADG